MRALIDSRASGKKNTSVKVPEVKANISERRVY